MSTSPALPPPTADLPAAASTVDPMPPALAPAGAVLTALAQSACGGGHQATAQPPAEGLPPEPPPAPLITSKHAARFLAQASMGITREQIARVRTLGYSAWIDEQIAMPSGQTRWDWMIAKGYDAPRYDGTEDGIDACLWRKLMSSPATLRQRMTLALSDILVVSLGGLVGRPWLAFSVAAYLDLLEAHAFGNYRALLEQVSLSPAMGEFLSYRGRARQDAMAGTMPDENYARELLQLFTIGLVDLDLEGKPKRLGGVAQESFALADVVGLARVFTGWDYDDTATDRNRPDFTGRPMRHFTDRHESGSKSFLGSTISAGTDGAASLRQALDTIFAHPNVGPFIGRQLIQRLVTSNPSPAYVKRVASVFNQDGYGQKGNLRAVLKAILLDREARDEITAQEPNFGKVREPILRLTGWGRAFAASSPSDGWGIGNTSDPSLSLGQSPMRAPSVFNFFQPDFTPQSAAAVGAGLVAPEMQLSDETSVIGYVNFIQTVISSGLGDVRADYDALQALAADASLLIEEISLLLTAGQLSAQTTGLVKDTLETMSAATAQARLFRIYAALTMVMASPEFLVQK